jgi:hypothetical protein
MIDPAVGIHSIKPTVKCFLKLREIIGISLLSYAQAFSENENFKKNSMLMERDILHKHKIENRSKKSFEIFILYRLKIFRFS